MKKLLSIITAAAITAAAIPPGAAYEQGGTTLVNLVKNGDFENGMPEDFTTAEERRGSVSRIAVKSGFAGVYTCSGEDAGVANILTGADINVGKNTKAAYSYKIAGDGQTRIVDWRSNYETIDAGLYPNFKTVSGILERQTSNGEYAAVVSADGWSGKHFLHQIGILDGASAPPGARFYIDDIEVYDITDAYEINADSRVILDEGSYARINGKNMTNAGDKVSFTVKEREGYSIAGVYVNGDEAVNENGRYIFTMPENDADITVKFRLLPRKQTAQISYAVRKYCTLNPNSDFSFLMAYYDDGGNLLELQEVTSETAKNTEQLMQSIDTKLKSGTAEVKCFLWKSHDSLIPLVQAETQEIIPEDVPDTDNRRKSEWTPINMISQEQIKSGVKLGGEGGQRIFSLAVSKDDRVLFCGNDTGGLNRSIDGGETWTDIFGGFYAWGATAIAIDPANRNKIIAAGSLQIPSFGVFSEYITDKNGIYISEDCGETWTQTLSQPTSATTFDFRESVAFDPMSENGTDGCRTAYWSRIWRLQRYDVPLEENSVITTDTDEKGLWKTTDGGKSWFVVNENMSDSIIKVHPTKGYVYAANPDGFFRSEDGGQSFTQILSGEMILGLDVIDKKGYEDYVWVNDGNGVLVSGDCGRNFTRISASGFPHNAESGNADRIVRFLKVSPVNPDNMAVGSYDGGNYRSEKYFSQDGGKTWALSGYDDSKDFFVSNNRHPVYAWSNTDENKVWSTGGDWITLSEDAGRTYSWHYEGGGEVFADQRTVFNVYDPNLFYYGSHDFNGAMTADGGKTWKYIWKTGSKYAGYVYGSYAADENTLIAIVSTDGVRSIWVSYDCGESWTDTGHEPSSTHKSAEMCYQSPTDRNVLFAANWRSADFGKTWTQMTEVDAVCTHNPYGKKEIYGFKGLNIFVSYDSGASWSKYASARCSGPTYENVITDMSYDGINGIMYYVTGPYHTGTYFGKLYNGGKSNTNLTGNLKRDSYFQLCAADPNHSDVVYVGGYMGNMSNPYGVQRSTDGGKTFRTLTTNGSDTVVTGGACGGINPYDIIVNPETSELWVSQSCNGWVKFPSPYLN